METTFIVKSSYDAIIASRLPKALLSEIVIKSGLMKPFLVFNFI